MKSKLTAKQKLFLDAFRSGAYAYLMGAGTTGSGKSIVMLGLLHLMASNINGMKFAVLRKTEKNLKQTTIPSYKKVKKFMRSSGDSYVVDMTAKYPRTGSEIIFVWADVAKDHDLDNVKGLEVTGALIEEANQINVKYFELLKTRIGRWNNHKCHPFILLNLNPAIGWCKDLFYTPWIEKRLPANHYFLEFDKTDVEELVASPDAAEMTDAFISSLNDLPEEERNRFVLNHWDYSEIPNQLVQYEWYKNCLVDESMIQKKGRGLLGLDPADQGKDPTVFGEMWGNHIGWWDEYPKQDPGDSGVIAVNKARDLGIKKSDVIIDGVGVGYGTLNAMKNEKFHPTVFIGGEEPARKTGFLQVQNRRAEGHWLFREGCREGEITLTHSAKLQHECTKCIYTITDRTIKIHPKEVLKKAEHIGHSPGHLDVAAMLAHHYYITGGDLHTKLKNRQIDSMKLLNKRSAITAGRQQKRHDYVRNALIGL
jgi:phage terminase large subunit